jgi:hypothetical protein
LPGRGGHDDMAREDMERRVAQVFEAEIVRN